MYTLILTKAIRQFNNLMHKTDFVINYKKDRITLVNMLNYNVTLICYIINLQTEAKCDISFSDQYIKLN